MEDNGEKIIMKLIRITLVLFLMLIICHLAVAAPNLDYLTINDCRSCHGDEDGNTDKLHHESKDCEFCHTSFLDDFVRNCDNCHADFNHHEGAERRCSDCHDDKQHKRQY